MLQLTCNIAPSELSQLQPEISELKTPLYLKESLQGLIVGCNKQQLLLHCIYNKGYIFWLWVSCDVSMMILSHNQIL